MARTTKAEIEEIIEIDVEIIPDDAAMAPFITAANMLVTQCCTGANGPSTAYDTTQLEMIERYLAAHFYTNRDPRASSEKAGPVGVSYQDRVDLGFDSSFYGQTAMRLDFNGGLAKVNEDTKKGKPTVGVAWLGTPYDEIPTE